ncbi:MAG TPA: lysophospholipid acyltransferase family protein [Ohtaekwangia sp.]|nr:lysophospholipid acyltransferase family protein [Ohtaekwangia sp.]
MKFLQWLHTAYGLVIFVLLFAILFPFFLIPILWPSQFRLVGVLNRLWARLVFLFVFLPFRLEYRGKLDAQRQYIFCPNHFSYLDIPAMGLSHHNTIFVGKNDMVGIPLFGLMYRKLHITVDRSKLKARYSMLERCREAVDAGKSLVIFPEGGIITEGEPVLSRFKDGAFRVAIEKQIPIVPVTIPYNWIILPADQFLLHWHPLKVVFHEPVETAGMTLKDLEPLKEKVYHIIHEELLRQIAYENRPRVAG